jgi:ATP-dependent protease ClpP protease subunit
MAHAIEHSKTPVYCVVTAEAASAGFYILQSCAQRMMLPGAKLMAHEIYRPWLEHVTRYEARQIADDLEKSAQEFIDYEVRRLSITRDNFIERTKGKNWEMGSMEALAVGAADEIVEDLDLTRPDRPALPAAWPSVPSRGK